MSFCNGISNLLTPDYAKLYMVHSEIMDEAKEAGGAFEGEIRICHNLERDLSDVHQASYFGRILQILEETRLFKDHDTCDLYRHFEGSRQQLLPADAVRGERSIQCL